MLDDADADHLHLIASEEGPFLGRLAFHTRNIPQADEIAVFALAENELAEIRGCPVTALDPRRELALCGFDAPGRQFHILGAQRIFHVVYGELARGKRGPVEPDAHGIAARAAEPDTCHPVKRRKAVYEIVFCIIGQLQNIHVRAHEVEPHDHVVAGIDLLNVGCIRFRRQVVQNAGHTVANIVCSGVDVASRLELDCDAGPSVLTRRLNERYSLDTGNAILNALRDAGLDDSRRRASIIGRYRYDRRINIGIFAQRQPVEGDEAESDKKQAENRCEDGPGNGNIRESHLLRLTAPPYFCRSICRRHGPASAPR